MKNMHFWLFFCNYLLVFTGILGPPKTSGTQGEPQGDPQCVFNCSGVGYFAMAASAMAAQDPGFPDFAGFADFHFSRFPAQYPGTFFTSLFPLPQEKRHIWRDLSQSFFFCTDSN